MLVPEEWCLSGSKGEQQKNYRFLAGRYRYISSLLLMLSRQSYYPVTTEVQNFTVVSRWERNLVYLCFQDCPVKHLQWLSHHLEKFLWFKAHKNKQTKQAIPLLIPEYCFSEKYYVLFTQQDKVYMVRSRRRKNRVRCKKPHWNLAFTAPISHLIISRLSFPQNSLPSGKSNMHFNSLWSSEWGQRLQASLKYALQIQLQNPPPAV